MASGSSEVRAGKAFVELGVKDTLKKGLERAASQLKAFGKAVTMVGGGMIALGGVVSGTLTTAAKLFADWGSDLYDMSVRTGATVESLSALGYAAQQAGADIGTVEFGVRRAQNAIDSAAAGSKEAITALHELGLTAAMLQELTPDQQFAKLAEKIAALETPAQRTASAMALFGRSGTMLLPMMMELGKLTDRARKLGLVMSTQDAQAADEFGDRLGELGAMLKMVTFHVGAAAAKALLPFGERVADIVGGIVDWVRVNRGLVVTLAAVAGAVTGAGVALVGIGVGVQVLGFALAGLANLGAILTAAFAAIVSPLGAAVVLSGALGVYLARSTEVGGKALQWLTDRFADLKVEALETFQAIRDAMAAGEWGTAAGVMWATLKLEWTKGAGALLDVWTQLKFGVLRTMQELWAGVAALHENAVHGMAKAVSLIQRQAESTGMRMKRDAEKAAATARTSAQIAAISRADSGIPIPEVKKRINELAEGLELELQLIDAKYSEGLDTADREHEQRLEGLNKTHEQELQEIAEQEIEAKRKLDSDRNAAEINAQLALDKARREFAEAVMEAADAPNRRLHTDRPDRRGAGAGDDGELPDLDELLKKSKRSFHKSVGTFSGFRPFGAAPAALDRIAASSKDIERNTRPLRNARPLVWK